MSHQLHDTISLTLARRIADGLSDHPEWIALAKSNLDRWSQLNHGAPALLACYQEWRELLNRPLAEISAALLAETDRGQRLRQNSPFAGALTPSEVWRMNGRQMKRQQLEHILRAAAAITGADRFVVIGSQSILGQFPNPPAELLVSIEADLFSLRNPHDAELIDGSIGEASPFHQTFGYYAHGVGEETAILPDGWKDRLIPIATPSTGGATGLCLEIHDLAVSKLVAGREKDLQFIHDLLRHRLINPDTLQQRLTQTPLTESQRTLCTARLTKMLQQ